MGLLDKIKASFGFTADNPVPAKAKFATREDVVYAPCSGVLVSLKEVNDEVVSAGLRGSSHRRARRRSRPWPRARYRSCTP